MFRLSASINRLSAIYAALSAPIRISGLIGYHFVNFGTTPLGIHRWENHHLRSFKADSLGILASQLPLLLLLLIFRHGSMNVLWSLLLFVNTCSGCNRE
jgi:hypothetical protein